MTKALDALRHFARRLAGTPPRRSRLTIRDQGQGNTVLVAPGDLQGEIIITGDGNRIEIGAGCRATGLRIEVGSACAVSIGEGGHLGDLLVRAKDRATVEVGANFTHAAGPRPAGRGLLIHGPDSRIAIGPGCQAGDLHLELGTACAVEIGQACGLGDLFVHAATQGRVTIGAGTGIGGTLRLLLHEPGEIAIGTGCLFASEIDVSISDMHSIVDAATGQRINPAASVAIEDRVWVGVRAMILKGAHIQAGSIIGACSVVSGSIAGNSVAAGAPAKVVRSGVTWRHELLPLPG